MTGLAVVPVPPGITDPVVVSAADLLLVADGAAMWTRAAQRDKARHLVSVAAAAQAGT